VVQLASHKETDQGTLETRDVVSFVNALEPYICKGAKKIMLDAGDLQALRLDTSVQTRRNTQRKQLIWHNEMLMEESTLSECRIPWLVPASNMADLNKHLFLDGMVAGLIPSERNARFDAYSYALSSSEVVNWVVEFRARSKSILNRACLNARPILVPDHV